MVDSHALHGAGSEFGSPDLDGEGYGNSVDEVLADVRYDAADMKRTMRMDVEAACRQGRLTLGGGKCLLNFYDDGLDGYTYLEE